MFKPSTPYTTPFYLLVPQSVRIKGVEKKEYQKLDATFFCKFKSYGGTEKYVNNILAVEDTAMIETYYDENIKSNCIIEVKGEQFEIIGRPENIEFRNQYMQFKVRAIKGGA